MGSFSVSCPMCVFLPLTRSQLLESFVHAQDAVFFFFFRVPDGVGVGLPKLRLGLGKLQVPLRPRPTRGHRSPPAASLEEEVDWTSRGKKLRQGSSLRWASPESRASAHGAASDSSISAVAGHFLPHSDTKTHTRTCTQPSCGQGTQHTHTHTHTPQLLFLPPPSSNIFSSSSCSSR